MERKSRKDRNDLQMAGQTAVDGLATKLPTPTTQYLMYKLSSGLPSTKSPSSQ